MNFRNQIDKVGIVAAAATAFCCLGITSVVSIVAALGLGVLINDAVLRPLLLISLGLMMFGLVTGWRRHGNPLALVLGVIGAVSLYTFVYVRQSEPFAYFSIAGLILASVLNVALARNAKPTKKSHAA